MNSLITYPAHFGQPSASPFCVKAMYVLNACGLDWQREDTNDPRKMPLAKLPVLRAGDRLIAGSDRIAAFARETGTDPDAALSPAERAAAHGLVRMAEEHLYFLLLLDRWERREVWPSTRDAYFHEIPALLRGLISGGIRRTVLSGLRAQGLGRMGWPERLDRARADFSALEDQLGDAPFLFGAAPHLVDASVASMLAAIAATPVRTDLQTALEAFPVLGRYAARVHDAFGAGNPPTA
jgi:glutathione S-transferase